MTKDNLYEHPCEDGEIYAESCECADGICEEFVRPTKDCVHRLAREHRVFMYKCECSSGKTWHIDGTCSYCDRVNAYFCDACFGMIEGKPNKFPFIDVEKSVDLMRREEAGEDIGDETAVFTGNLCDDCRKADEEWGKQVAKEYLGQLEADDYGFETHHSHDI